MQYQGQGFHIVGFFSDDFGNQAGDPGQIDACNGQYAVTFEQFQVDHVRPSYPNENPAFEPRAVYKWLASQPGFEGKYPTWNFHKYLIARDGTLVADWDSPVDPGIDNPNDPNDIPSRIATEVAKPVPPP